MDKTVITGLLIALVSGITVLAYKHPLAFKRLYWPISLFLVAALFGVSSWNSAINAVLLTVKDLIPAATFMAISTKAHDLDVPSWYSWGIGVFMFYVGFLLFLPELTGDDSKKERPKVE